METEDDEDTLDEGDGAGKFGAIDSGSVGGAPKQSGGDLRPRRPPDLLRQSLHQDEGQRLAAVCVCVCSQ